MFVRVTPADTRDVDLFRLCVVPTMRKSVLSFNLRLSFNFHKRISDMQFSMIFKAENWSVVCLGLNEM